MSYSNGLLPDQSYQTANKYVQRGLPGVGFKLTDTGDYDMQNKKLTNVKGCRQNLGHGPWASPWATLWATLWATHFFNRKIKIIINKQ